MSKVLQVAGTWLVTGSVYIDQLNRWGHVTINTLDRELGFAPGEGGLMGHHCVPPVSVLDYTKHVASWNLGLSSRAPSSSQLVCRGPITGCIEDLSMPTFVDDVAKIFVQTDPQNLGQICEEVFHSARELDTTMEARNYAMNQDKTVAVLGLRGPGSGKTTKQLTFGQIPIYGTPARHARYLGPHISQFSLEHIEVRSRIAAMSTAWSQLGRIWYHTLPWRVHRLLIIAFLQNTLLSGLQAFTLTTSQHRLMDRALSRLLKSMMKRSVLELLGDDSTEVEQHKFRASVSQVHEY